MADYRQLLVWQKSKILVVSVYKLTHTFPSFEVFGLSSQMQRAAVSIISNIAEGCGRQADREFLYFLRIAKGSLFELESQLYIAKDLDYITEQELAGIEALCEEISKMLARLMKSVEFRIDKAGN